ncbi:unnamed protein product [Prorocentrum cordatum]|uniref:Uncharacterized protein n=1 Tax=Prorocentrum cordatum TaxID=2364126 RepID=A0ABN9SX53_9DINO|nr:unnamed protein product [Polarella glacialis]
MASLLLTALTVNGQLFEGPSLLPPAKVTATQRLHFESPEHCATMYASEAVEVPVRIGHDLPPGQCVTVAARSARERVWYYIVPPSANYDQRWQFCVDEHSSGNK